MNKYRLIGLVTLIGLVSGGAFASPRDARMDLDQLERQKRQELIESEKAREREINANTPPAAQPASAPETSSKASFLIKQIEILGDADVVAPERERILNQYRNTRMGFHRSSCAGARPYQLLCGPRLFHLIDRHSPRQYA